jgi:hypothetical protein
MYAIQKPIPIRGDDFAYIAYYSKLNPDAEVPILTGEIHRYTNISEEDWENLQSRKPASKADLQTLNIPEHLKPNSDAFRFLFFVKEHRLVVQLKGKKRTLGHQAVKTFFDKMLERPEINKLFPMVDVTIEQKPDSLERILKMPMLSNLCIYVKRPNSGDDYDEEQERWIEKMLGDQNARSTTVQLEHTPGKSLEPNEANLKLARAATSSGKVVGSGKGPNGRPLTVDTSNHEIRGTFDYDNKARLPFIQQMLNAALALLAQVAKAPRNATSEDKTP